jgi:hypothetical protein
MRALVNVIVWAVGLAILLGTPADTLARYPKFVVGKTYCTCNCAAKNVGIEEYGWENAGSCTGANGSACSFTRGGKKASGKLEECAICKADIHGACNYVRVGNEPLRPQARPPASDTK